MSGFSILEAVLCLVDESAHMLNYVILVHVEWKAGYQGVCCVPEF